MLRVRKNVALILASVFLIFTVSILPNALVVAQDSAASPGSGLRISPTRNELVLKPSESQEITQTVKNVTQSPVTVQPVLNDFEADGVSGEPKLIGDPEKISAYSLREFVSLPEDFDLQPDEEREVKVRINVPDAASPGAYFSSVIYRAVPQGSTGSGQVSLLASVGSLLLLEVPGDLTEKISIDDIGAYLGKKRGSLFLKKPDNVGVMVKNLGNGFAKPFGKVALKDWRGKQIFEYELNNTDPRANVLPDANRLFLDELYNIETKTVNEKQETTRTSPLKMPGRYTIVGNISHGTRGEVYTVSSTFWYLPLWILITLLVLLVGIVGLTFLAYRKFHIKSPRRR
jgi:hypothetical protein